MLQHACLFACSLQTFDGVQMTECIKKLIRLDEKWIPAKRGWSLYIRLSSLPPPPTCTASVVHCVGRNVVVRRARLP